MHGTAQLSTTSSYSRANSPIPTQNSYSRAGLGNAISNQRYSPESNYNITRSGWPTRGSQPSSCCNPNFGSFPGLQRRITYLIVTIIEKVLSGIINNLRNPFRILDAGQSTEASNPLTETVTPGGQNPTPIVTQNNPQEAPYTANAQKSKNILGDIAGFFRKAESTYEWFKNDPFVQKAYSWGSNFLSSASKKMGSVANTGVKWISKMGSLVSSKLSSAASTVGQFLGRIF